MAAGYRAGLELAVGSKGRTNVRETDSPATLPAAPVLAPLQPLLTGRVKGGGHGGPLKSSCLSLSSKRPRACQSTSHWGSLPFPINSVGSGRKGIVICPGQAESTAYQCKAAASKIFSNCQVPAMAEDLYSEERDPKDSFSWSHSWPHILANVKNSVTKSSSLYLGFISNSIYLKTNISHL